MIKRKLRKLVLGVISLAHFILIALLLKWKKASRITKYVAIPIIIVLLISGSIFTYLTVFKEKITEAAGESWLTGWDYRQEITIDATKIDDILTNFPVAVMFSSTTFDYTHAQGDGDDIRFTDSDGETLIDFEREIHSTSTDSYVYHTEIPSVASSTDDTFYMYYGNSVASDAASSTAVWDINHKAVLHLNADCNDSTSNANNFTDSGSTDAVGKISGAQELDGLDPHRIDAPVFSSMTEGQISFWIHFDDLSVERMIYQQRYLSSAGDSGVGSFQIDNAGTTVIRILVHNGTTWVINYNSSVDSVSTLGFYYVTIAWDGTNGYRTYINGAQDGSDTDIQACFSASADYLPAIGSLNYVTIGEWQFVLDGIIDEFRIEDENRGAAWIKASYNSGNDSLLSYGSEETPSKRRIMIIQ